MEMAAIFLLALLAAVLYLNWGTLFGGNPRCGWSRIHERDRDGEAAWFCPVCGTEAFVRGNDTVHLVFDEEASKKLNAKALIGAYK